MRNQSRVSAAYLSRRYSGRSKAAICPPPEMRLLLLFVAVGSTCVAARATAFSHHGRSSSSRRLCSSPRCEIRRTNNNASSSPVKKSHVGLRLALRSNSSNASKKQKGLKSKRPAAATVAELLGPIMLMALTVITSTVSNAVTKAPALTATAANIITPPSLLVLPTVTRLALVCLLPTLLGYYKSEYGVSYGYGTAMAASSYLILVSIANAANLPLLPGLKDCISLSVSSFQSAGILSSLQTTIQNLKVLLPTSLSACHAAILLFYGLRLDIFLLYREVFIVRFRVMRERIEDRAKKQGNRLNRTPFLLSCAFLYFCMMSPLLITCQVCNDISMTIPPSLLGGTSLLGLGGVGGISITSILELLLRSSIVMTLLGFLLGALGDLNKTVGKAWQGEDALITGGIFRFFRHPNYTGEVIGWVSSCLAGFLAVLWKTVSISSSAVGGSNVALWKSMSPYLLTSLMGAIGISFVLVTATTGLEFRQKEKYGDTEEYKKWIKKSWVGFKMATKKGKDPEPKSELQLVES